MSIQQADQQNFTPLEQHQLEPIQIDQLLEWGERPASGRVIVSVYLCLQHTSYVMDLCPSATPRHKVEVTFIN